MSRRRWVVDRATGKLEEITDFSRPEDQSAFVRQDTMAPIEHPGSGKIFDSRTQYDAETKRLGLIPAGGCDYDSNLKQRRIDNQKKLDERTKGTAARAYTALRDNMIKVPELTREARELVEHVRRRDR